MTRARNAHRHRLEEHPDFLTSVIRVPADQFDKAEWNYERFSAAVEKRPCDPEEVGYTAIDFCIAVAALRDWAKRSHLRNVRGGKGVFGVPVDGPGFEDWCRASVPWQAAIENIANASKHGTYRDANWPNGIASLNTCVPASLQAELDAVPDGIALLGFMRKHRDSSWWDVSLRKVGDTVGTDGVEAFGRNLDEWQNVLGILGLR